MKVCKKLCSVVLALVLTACGGKAVQQEGFRPVNEKATPEAVQLLDFLYSIQGEYTLTGMHNFASGMERYDSVVHALTGKTPVVWGADFSFNVVGDNVCDFRHCGPLNLTVPGDREQPCAVLEVTTAQQRQRIVDTAIRKHAEGRVITLMWHCCWPVNCDECDGDDIWRWADKLPTQQEWDELLTDGTPLNRAWKTQMDGVAACLKQLQEAKVPILWRPFHEMNGIWFWWCGKPGENGFKRLWIAMYNYFTRHHGLNNLLWVWDANAPRTTPGDEAGPYADYYPGNDYVDVLAADVYHGDWKQSHHDELLDLGRGKVIALGEVGDLPSAEVYEKQTGWAWFMPWGYFILNENNRRLAETIYNHPRSLTLDEMDFSGNAYELKNK